MTPFDSARLDPQTFGGALVNAARQWPDNLALVIGERRATYRQLLNEAIEAARGLAGLGVRPGDNVGLFMQNCWEYVVLFYASALAGACAVTLNARYREDDLGYVIAHADIRCLFIGGHVLPHTDYRALVQTVFPETKAWRAGEPLTLAAAPALKVIVNLGDSRETAWPVESHMTTAAQTVPVAEIVKRAAAVKPTDVGLMMFSSGTTARPKCCMLSHGALTRTGHGFAKRFKLTVDDRLWDPLPMFHMSTMLPMTACRAVGAAFIGREHFDAAPALVEIEREGATILYCGFPAIMGALIARPDFPSRNLAGLRIAHCVGPADLLRRYVEAFPNAKLISAYGLTEASGVITYGDCDDDQETLFDTCGKPFDGIVVQITDPDAGKAVAQGEAGEIWITGNSLFEGYYKDKAQTEKVMAPGNWLRSGDLGSVDAAGRIVYRGRLKDMLKIGGENVAAVEIESFLHTHPAIAMAQVVSAPDERLMEVAAAFVQLHPGAVLTEEEVVRYCLGKIASYKVPRYVRFVTEWPMSATKVQKFRLLDGFTRDRKLDPKTLA